MVNRLFVTLFSLWIYSTSLYAWKIEANSITVNSTVGNTITHINFRQSYETIPLVFLLASNEGSDSATLRIKNITSSGFDVYTVEPDGNDGEHDAMTSIPYIAIEEGSHEFPDGTKIEAYKVSTSIFQGRKIQGKSWDSISLNGFSSTPIVLGQIQSVNSERTDVSVPSSVSQPWMTTAINSVSSTGFSFALERSETESGTLQSEEVAYLVMEGNLNGTVHSFLSNSGQNIAYESIVSSVYIKGWNNSSTGYSVGFSQSYTNPIAIATKSTRKGNNGGWLRRCSISTNSINLVVDEDISSDTERSHIAESASVLVFSQPFDAEFRNSGKPNLKIQKSSYTVYDPILLSANPKAIPGAIVEYTINVENQGDGEVDNNSVVISDVVPENMKLCTANILECSEVGLTQGITNSGLTLGSVEYSNNNGTSFNYTPTADGYGFDSMVTDIRMNMNGVLEASDGVNHPSFQLKFKMGIN
ncbi:MAG: hypothetical protein K0U38_05120 [Epsilonproteobacteria bacterium]|nr:hypothetical protein [Campylobacterota bacterium]